VTSTTTILSLDPSSTCTGWAVLKPGEVYVASGRLLPVPVRGVPKGYEPYQRIASMCQGLVDLLGHYQPGTIVIEFTSGKRAGRLGTNVSGLAIYGAAVGAIWREAVNWADHNASCVKGVLENEWTGSRPKFSRGRTVGRVVIAAAMFRNYDPEADKGGDEADALMLGVFYQRQLAINEARS
jgi:Holliday junction resolvasome RuvABC endonuclease subunit